MSLLKKIFVKKPNKTRKSLSFDKPTSVHIEKILNSNKQPEILFKSRVVLAFGVNKELNDENAFKAMGISEEKLKNKILESYVWQSFGEDIDFSSFMCTMQLVRIDVQEKYKPEVDVETSMMRFFNAIEEKEKNDEIINKEPPRLEAFKKVPWMTDLRLKNVTICLNAGFNPANSLPTKFDRKLRPSIEIAKRLNAIKASVLWLLVPEEKIKSQMILNFVENNNLRNSMDANEKVIFKSPRDDEKLRYAIVRKLENAWPLAWFFGYKPPDITGKMITGEQIQEIIKDFSCPLDQSVEEWVKNTEVRLEESILAKEDLFYCLHNAVRRAQLGRDSVPSKFDPIENGGVIEERRYSLTWMLSNCKKWEDIDLST